VHGYELGYGVISTGFLNQVTSRVGMSGKALGLSWLAIGKLLGRVEGEGYLGRLGRLHGEAKFRPKAAKDIGKPFLYFLILL
jgi:hypothetical protein